ncbi:hypothetical protein B0H16DRAFT_1025062 [Mycena metata]|uniref:F-box domain-containing protein n=1 Tax=Mycena metata TaxID=1033252 RepID=A0AAD7N278_9AGAR|nr:hypothetical protein B0H16DRAFT_1025062 [Mycena metata]
MHRALTVPQVLHLICLEIGSSRGSELGKNASRDLAVLARTCTLISKPALDVLWQFQDTIIPLLDCMPPTIWQKDRSLRRPIIPSDWERPRIYMHRVQFLSCTDASFPPGIDVPGLFEILRLSLPTQYLFPNLRGLRWIFNQIPALPLVPLVLAPGIKVIAIGTFKSIPHLIILAALSARCPYLTTVKLLQPDSPERDQLQAVSFFVRRLTHIQALEVANLDQAGFEHLVRAPHLHTLIVKSPSITPAFLLPNDPVQNFASLRYLVLKFTPLQSVLAFIRALSRSSPILSFSPLTSLTVDVSPPPDASSLMQIYVALKINLPRATLTTLRITSHSLPNRPTFQVEPPAITIATVRYLFHFSNLTRVGLRPPTGVDLTDDDVLAMTEAWPNLEHLSLRSRSNAHPLRTTLLSLFHFAQRCPQLETLEMSLDASIVPEVGNRYTRVLQHSLIQWEVADSPITSALSVARFLSGLFPELFEIYTKMQDVEAAGEHVAQWAEVVEMLPICHEMRGEERHWVHRHGCDCDSRAESVEL